jgi:hypothetical protein
MVQPGTRCEQQMGQLAKNQEGENVGREKRQETFHSSTHIKWK